MAESMDTSEETPIHVLEIAGNAIVGGMEKYVSNLVQYLPTHNFKLTTIAPYESFFTAVLRELGSDVFITSMDNDPPWRSIQFTTELIRHQNVDLIHAHLPRAHVLAGLAGRLTNTPVVATVHGMDLTAHELGISRVTGTHLIVVCNDAYAQALSLGKPAERLSLIPNGVDTKAFHPGRSGAGFRKAINIPASVPLVGFVGRLAWEKGPDQFARLAEIIHHEVPEAHFVMVGDGPMEKEIRGMIETAGLQSHFHLAGLWNNTCEVYPALDIVVQTSRVEGMPFAVLEAMASGKPVAAMGVGGVPEMVEVGTCGILSAPDDWRGLAEGIIDLLNNPIRMRTMGHASRKRTEENFDLQHSIRLTANLFRRLTGRKGSKESTSLDNWSVSGNSLHVESVGRKYPAAPKAPGERSTPFENSNRNGKQIGSYEREGDKR